MIIEALKEIQKRDKLTDTQLAVKLDVHPISWSRLKNGRAGYGKEFISRAVKAFPEISEAALEELWGPNYLNLLSTAILRILTAGLGANQSQPEQ